MDDKKIKKLLSSSIIDDVKIGWEFLKEKNIPHDSHEWHQWFDCFRLDTTQEALEFKRTLIREICPDYRTNPMWLAWSPKKVEL